MAKLSFRRSGYGLYPSDDVTMKWLEEVQQNIDIIGDLRVPRNAKNHRHMFGILNEAAENIDGFAGIDELLEYLKLEAGMYKVRTHHQTTDWKEVLRAAWRKQNSFASVKACILWIFDQIAKKSYIRNVEVITYESLNFESMDEVRFKRVKARFLWILKDK